MTKFRINNNIIIDKDICHGKPVFEGTRIMVWQVLEILASGGSENEVFEAFPPLTKEHLMSAFDYASSTMKESSVLINFNAA